MAVRVETLPGRTAFLASAVLLLKRMNITFWGI